MDDVGSGLRSSLYVMKPRHSEYSRPVALASIPDSNEISEEEVNKSKINNIR
jgi:hypothetical protein